jgi:hypothetical protein
MRPKPDPNPEPYYPSFYMKLTPDLLKQIAQKGVAKIEYELTGINLNIRDGETRGSCDVKVKSITPLTPVKTAPADDTEESESAMEKLIESLPGGSDSSDEGG